MDARTLVDTRSLSMVVTLLMIFTFATVNARDEQQMLSDAGLYYSLVVVLLWITLPVIVFVLYISGRIIAKESTLNFGYAMTVLGSYAIVYGYYALNGPTDPNGAAHMHLIVAPVLLGVPAAIFIAAMTLRVVSAIRHKRRAVSL